MQVFIRISGGDEIFCTPIVEVSENELQTLLKFFPDKSKSDEFLLGSIHEEWNSASLWNADAIKQAHEAKREEERKRADADKAKRQQYVTQNTYGSSADVMRAAFERAAKAAALN